MRQGQKGNVSIGERGRVRGHHRAVGKRHERGVHIAHTLPRPGTRSDRPHLNPRVGRQDAQKLAAGVTGGASDGGPDHFSIIRIRA